MLPRLHFPFCQKKHGFVLKDGRTCCNACMVAGPMRRSTSLCANVQALPFLHNPCWWKRHNLVLYFSSTQRDPGRATGAGGVRGGGGTGRRRSEHLAMPVLEACGRLELGLWPCGDIQWLLGLWPS